MNWHKDDREGRFLLRRIDEKTNVNIYLFILVLVLYLLIGYKFIIICTIYLINNCFFKKKKMPAGTFQEAGSSFKRKLSKREKKQLKKQEKLNRAKSHGLSTNDENDAGVAEKLYTGIIIVRFNHINH